MSGATSAPSVCAVVLTFDDLGRVRGSFESVAAQTRRPDELLVVDNHSRDGTGSYLGSLADEHTWVKTFRTEENLGPAGGFAVGLELALAGEWDYFWLLDDDSRPEPECLERLIAASSGEPKVVLWPKNVDETGRESRYPAWRGELLPYRLVAAAGVPRRDFFWGQEDTEYLQWRLPRQHGAVIVPVDEAVVRYTQANPRKRASWHYYYLTRNTVFYRLHVQRPRKLRKLLASTLWLSLRAASAGRQSLRNLRFLTRGVRDGLRGRLGKTVDPGRGAWEAERGSTARQREPTTDG